MSLVSAAERSVDSNSTPQSCPQGRDGRDGRDGAQGEKGEAGSLRYPGLRGEKGDSGQQGERGDRGEQGQPGFKGITGMSGQKGEKGAPSTTSGVTYTRWGKYSCPNIHGTELVYAGKTGGTKVDESGGGANYLCMPSDPEYSLYGSGCQQGSYVYGAEYSLFAGQPNQNIHDHDAPCAVCFASARGSLLMIPAKLSCPTSWIKEYDGYLMTERHSYSGRTMYICVDRLPDSVAGQDSHDSDRVELFSVEAKCEGLSCPPYSTEKELTCVVCTR